MSCYIHVFSIAYFNLVQWNVTLNLCCYNFQNKTTPNKISSCSTSQSDTCHMAPPGCHIMHHVTLSGLGTGSWLVGIMGSEVYDVDWWCKNAKQSACYYFIHHLMVALELVLQWRQLSKDKSIIYVLFKRQF